jgi:deoxyribonuclease-4
MSGKAAKMMIGAHLHIAKGFHTAVEQGHQIGAKSLGVFTGSQRAWFKKKLTAEAAEQFKNACKKYGYHPDYLIAHGSYLINLGTPEPVLLAKSRAAFIDEMQRCEQLGLHLYNFHPGSAVGGIETDKALEQVAEAVNIAHSRTTNVIACVENTAGQGNALGRTFEQLKKIIDKVKDQSRVGVCLDTCHLFVAGYDLRTKEGAEKVFKEFDEIVGLNYLRGIHLNDSKREHNCRVDRHENIGKGVMGLEGFKWIVNNDKFANMPLVCETEEPFDEQIKLLYSLIDE